MFATAQRTFLSRIRRKMAFVRISNTHCSDTPIERMRRSAWANEAALAIFALYMQPAKKMENQAISF
jgi:hypothetical protein